MTRGMIFWVLMILWFIFGLIVYLDVFPDRRTVALAGNNLLLFVLLALLGWDTYGPVVKG